MNPKRTTSLFFAAFSLVLLSACTKPQNPQELKEKTAQTTAEVKRDAKAVAEGIREGWSRDKPLNLNSATKEQLVTLPGINAQEADRIVTGRPYRSTDELVSRRILPKAEYDGIKDLVAAK